MSLGIIKQMLEKKEPVLAIKTNQEAKNKEKRKSYKEILRKERQKREDAFLLRHPKKKPAIRKLKDRSLNRPTKMSANQPTMVETIENERKKTEENYKVRMKAWKEQFHGKGKIASSIASSVFFSSSLTAV